ncbi:hypothetical protein CHUAL_007682 [Chamberlinius hualienensis]
MYLEVYCMMNCDVRSENKFMYLRYQWPIPSLVLAASLRSPDGDDLGCSRLQKPQWLWRGSALMAESFQLPPTADIQRSYINLIKKYLPNDNLTMEVTATVGDQVFVKQVTFTPVIQIMVVPSPITAIIGGGARRTISRQNQLKLDASYSFDPDHHLDETTMSFTWYCKAHQKVTHQPRQLEIIFEERPFTLPVSRKPKSFSKFLNQCSSRKGKRNSQCRPHFRANAEGQLECSSFDKPFTNSEDSFVVINPDLLSSNYYYVFRVVVTAKGNVRYPSSTTFQEIFIEDQAAIPDITIKYKDKRRLISRFQQPRVKSSIWR